MSDRSLRVLILGTGAMAKLVGARLSRTGRAGVTLAGTWAAAIEEIAREGVTVDEDAGVWNAPVRAMPRDALGRDAAFDLVLVLVKSHQTAAVAPIAARAVASEGIVLTLQNGIGNREVLAVAAGALVGPLAERVVAGVTAMGATGLGSARVRAGGPGLTVIGSMPATRPMVRQVAALWRAAGMEVGISDDIDRLLWRKLAVNCAINPLAALLSVPNGRLLEAPEPRATLEAAAREVGAVAAARGIDLGEDPAALALDVARRTAGNRASMLQDLQRGAPTEIEAINGAVVREARRLGVPVPVNTALWQAVREREAGEAREREAGEVRTPSARPRPSELQPAGSV